MTNQIIISDITIHKDVQGRYSLNDLHQASGGEEKDKPANWLRLDKTVELIDEILNAQIRAFKPVDSRKGRYGGTYVCKELVYSYAMWISAAFALKVIRAYDALVSGDTQKAEAISKTSVDERTPLRDAVNMLVSKKHLMYPEAYAMVHQRFNVKSIEDLAPEQITDAIEYVHRIAIEGEYIGRQQALPKPELTLHLPLSWFSEHAPHAVYRINGEERLELDYRALREMISPSFLVFDALTKLGYDVSAAVAESKAMRHVMIEQAWALKEITKYVGVKDKASIRISI
ncbi:KilA-N domain-containing protein [Salmonella enterica]|nr:KilA-N domain-containing protein [Salmonella enterica]